MKKIFSLSAIVAMLAMLATSVSVSSCSKDDDDDSTKTEKKEVVTKTITLNVGNSKSTYGSFISISEGAVYTMSTLDANVDKVEFCYGDALIPASESVNAKVKANGVVSTLTKTNPGEYKFTVGKYYGTIKVAESGNDAVLTVERSYVKE
ncbi:MAG: hypothetical protein MJZ24_06940 [Paludibacteraceae bacterium]|nr:hypothetical protein [Candidatus Physcocola equi]MCQ2234453.1 hypothetical protein [Paludibacteraceae bacterium]